MAQTMAVSASFVERQREALVVKMKSAFTEQSNKWSGSSCTYIPSHLSAEEKKREWERQQQYQHDAADASKQMATWAAEVVRQKEDPQNDLKVLGWSIVSNHDANEWRNPLLVEVPVPANCIKNFHMFRLRQEKKRAAEHEGSGS